MLAGATALDGTGALNGLSEQQDLFGDGGFTRIRVRDDRKVRLLGRLRRNSADIQFDVLLLSGGLEPPWEKCAGQHLRIRAPMRATTPRGRVSDRPVGKQEAVALHAVFSPEPKQNCAALYPRSEKYPAQHLTGPVRQDHDAVITRICAPPTWPRHGLVGAADQSPRLSSSVCIQRSRC